MKHSIRYSFICGIFLATMSVPSMAEYRCGWLENPTPGNWWLTDRDRAWIISMQGMYSLADEYWDFLPTPKQSQFVSTNLNGNYGYSCACLHVTTQVRYSHELEETRGYITRIHKKGKSLPLKQCLDDVNLGSPPK